MSDKNVIDDFGTDIKASDQKVDQDCAGLIKIDKSIDTFTKCSTSLFKKWNKAGNDYYPCKEISESLNPGLYRIYSADVPGGIIFNEIPIITDDLLAFSDAVSTKVTNEISKFWDKKSLFKKYLFSHKRGYLFYGPQGSGKTCLVQQIIKDVISRNGIALKCDVNIDLVSSALKILREIEPETKIICIYEDIDSLIEQKGEHQVLSILDGEDSLDYVIQIATTNYPERLDKRIIARPRRFDRIIKIDMPNNQMRREYLTKKLKLENENIDLWVEKTNGFSFAALADLVISVKCLENDFDECVKTLKGLMNSKKHSNEFNEIGFGYNKKENDIS